MGEREQAFTIVLASAGYDVGRTIPHPMYMAAGGGLSRNSETGQEFFSMSMRVSNGRMRRPVELSIYMGRDEFAAAKADPASMKPCAVWASGHRGYWGPVLFDDAADPEANVMTLGTTRSRPLQSLTNAELAGAIAYAATVMQKAQKTDNMIARIGRALKPGIKPKPIKKPTRSEVQFFREISDILGPDAVPQDFR